MIYLGKFAFITHPKTTGELARRYGIPGIVPPALVNCLSPLVLPRVSLNVRVESGHGCAKGVIFSLPVTSGSGMIVARMAAGRVRRACLAAVRTGVNVLGVDRSLLVKDCGLHELAGIPFSTGRNLAVAGLLEGALKAFKINGANPGRSHVLVLGAAGEEGQAASEFIARRVGELTLVDSDLKKLDRLAKKILYYAGLSAKITSVQLMTTGTSIVVNATGQMLNPSVITGLGAGSVVCHIDGFAAGGPRGTGRKDIVELDGVIFKAPGKPAFDLMLPAGMIRPEIAECALIAMEGNYGCCTGQAAADSGAMELVIALAGKHGFKIAAYTSPGSPFVHQNLIPE